MITYTRDNFIGVQRIQAPVAWAGPAINRAEAAVTPAKGLMVISEDNVNGPAEAQLTQVAL